MHLIADTTADDYITSPNYPDHYNDNTNVCWTFDMRPEVDYLQWVFEHFETETDDFLRLYAGSYPSGTPIERYLVLQ